MDSQTSANGLLYPRDLRSPRAVRENFRNDFSMRSLLCGHQLYASGRHLNAIMALEYGLTHDPDELRLHMMLAVVHAGLGRSGESAAHIEALRRIQPSGEAAAAFEAFIGNWKHLENKTPGLPLISRNSRNRPPHLTTSLLGIEGGFGNQIFQYAFAKLYSEKYGLRYETYDWIGRRLFDNRDPGVSAILPFILGIEFLRPDMFSVPPMELGVADRDCQGYFQGDTRYYAPYRKRFADLFKPVSSIEACMQEFVSTLRGKGKTLVAVHIRCGDAEEQGRKSNARIYADWLKEAWPTLDAPVLFLASDDLNGIREEFAAFDPFTSEQVRTPIPDAGFYPDFYVMSQADCLAAGNSTFSFAAGMLNERARIFLRPDAGNRALVPYDPWSSQPIL